MRVADNHIGWSIESIEGGGGWKVCYHYPDGEPVVFDQRDGAVKVMEDLRHTPAGQVEMRVYEAVKEKK